VGVQGVILFFSFLLEFFLEVEYNGAYAFEVFVPFTSCTRDVPSAESNNEEDQRPFTKLHRIVPARY